MTLVSPRRISLCAVACALAAVARTAAADPPPSDLPPLARPTSAAPPPAPGAPAPPGLAWLAPGAAPAGSAPAGSVPPGYAPPGYAPPGYAPPGYAPPGYYAGQYPMTPQSSYVLPEPLPRRRRDGGLFVGGVVAVAGGMAAVLVGAYLVSSAAGAIDIYCDSPSFPCAHKTDAVRLTGGAIMMAGGTALGIAGIPMWLIGSQYVTLPTGEKKAALPPEVRVGAGSASVTFHF